MALDSESARMNASAGVFAVSCMREHSTGAKALQREQQLNRFLAEVERRAAAAVHAGQQQQKGPAGASVHRGRNPSAATMAPPS